MKQPKHILKYTRLAMLAAGAIRIPTQGPLSFVYNTWAYFSQAYFTFFCFSFALGLKPALEKEENVDFNKQTFLLSYLSLWKLALSYTAQARELVHEVGRIESEIFEDDTRVVEIYNRGSRYNHRMFFFLSAVYGLTSYFSLSESVSGWFLMHEGNATGAVYALKVAGWFPFDTQRYFAEAYGFQAIAALFIGFYSLTFDSFFISLMNFPTAIMDVLGYKLEYIDVYSTRRNQSIGVCLRNIIVEHQNIIQYIQDLNNSLKWFFFGDFLIKSYHISLALTNVVHATKETFGLHTFILMFLFTQVLSLYYHANEIVLKSATLCRRVFQSNWYDQNPKLKSSLIILMMRSQKSSTLNIGFLGVIDNELIVKIMKAAYTFVLFQLDIYGSE